MTEHQNINRKLWVAGALTLVTILIFVIDKMTGCSVEPKKKIVYQNPPIAQCDEGMKVGDTKEEACEGGKKLFVCTDKGLEEKVNTCSTGGGGDDGGSCVAFDANVGALLAANCVSCHAQLQEYTTAKNWSGKIVARTTADPSDRKRMPPAPKDPLSAEDLQMLLDWDHAGAPQNCDGGNPPPARTYLDLDYIEALMLQDLNRIDPTQQPNTRYLVSAHKVDEGAVDAVLATYEKAANKTLNSVNVRRSALKRVEAIDDKKTIWRFNIEDFGLDAAKWAAIEAGDRLKIVSNTNIGLLLKAIVGTKQPWFHIDNFTDVTQRNAAVYYKLTETPDQLSLLQLRLGVDFAQDLRDLDALFVGGNKSPISLLKNRLLSRLESDDGYYWETFDPQAVDVIADRNLFEFPLLRDAGGQRNFRFDASEVIYTLKNGMQGYALFNAAGVRQNAAPLNVVADNRSPITPEIKNAISCHRCHAGGVIPMQDQIRDHVLQNAAQFPVNDVEIVKGLYEPQPRADAAFKADAEKFGAALAAIGVPPTEDDPINVVTDKFLLDWDLNRTASFLLLREQDLEDCLNQSATAKAQIGQLLTGGTISYEQFVQVLPVLIRDCRLFEEPLDEIRGE